MSTVLAVDDDLDILALFEVTLMRAGHAVELAATADEAADVLRHKEIDLVLLDVMMPGRDGWSLLDEIKADDSLSSIPVIMVTARGEPQDRLRGGVGGALVYITKPFAPQELLDTMAEVLASPEPEPARRRRTQKTSLSELAKLESGRIPSGPKPRLASLALGKEPERPAWQAAADRLGTLTENQKALVSELGRGRSVARVAATRKVSRSNIYASVRRIHRKLGTRSIDDLVVLARESGLLE